MIGCMSTHGVVISVLADLLMLTCSACLLGPVASSVCFSLVPDSLFLLYMTLLRYLIFHCFFFV